MYSQLLLHLELCTLHAAPQPLSTKLRTSQVCDQVSKYIRYICIYLGMHVHMQYACTFVCAYVHVHVHVYVYAYIYMYMNIYTHKYAYTYTYTCTCTYTYM